MLKKMSFNRIIQKLHANACNNSRHKVIIRMVDVVIKEEITKTTKHTFLKVKNPISPSYLRSQFFYMSASKFSVNTLEKYIDELVTKF